MANQQLLDYVKQQLQLGVSREAVKSTLLGSGWSEPDIAEALSAAGGGSAVAAAAPAQPMTSDIFPKASPAAKSEPAAQPAKPAEPAFQAKMNAMSSASPVQPAIQAAQSGKPGRSWTGMIFPIGAGLLVLILLGMATYLFMENAQLNENLAKGSQDNNDLSRQVAGLTQEKSGLLSQITTLTEDRADMSSHLNFLLIPAAGPSAEPLLVTIKGTLKGDDRTPYTLTTARGLTVNIRNYNDPAVNATLKPLLDTEVLVTGSHAHGSRDFAVTAVNGTAIAAPAASTQSEEE